MYFTAVGTSDDRPHKKFPGHKSHYLKYHINPSTVFDDFQNIQSLGSALYTERSFSQK
jgi:hypothetical protein